MSESYRGKTAKTARGISYTGSFLLAAGERFTLSRTAIADGKIDAERMGLDVARVFVAFRASSGYVKHDVRLSNEAIEGDGSTLLRAALAAGDATFHNAGKCSAHVTVTISAVRRE